MKTYMFKKTPACWFTLHTLEYLGEGMVGGLSVFFKNYVPNFEKKIWENKADNYEISFQEWASKTHCVIKYKAAYYYHKREDWLLEIERQAIIDFEERLLLFKKKMKRKIFKFRHGQRIDY